MLGYETLEKENVVTLIVNGEIYNEGVSELQQFRLGFQHFDLAFNSFD